MYLLIGTSKNKCLCSLNHSFHTLQQISQSSILIIYRHHITTTTTSSTTQAPESPSNLLAIPKASSSLSTVHLFSKMAIFHAKQILRRSLSFGKESASPSGKIQKGHVAVYVGEEERKRYTVPVSYLNQPLFQDLLSRAEEEFGYEHPMGGLTIPCSEDTFLAMISQLWEL